MTPLPDRVQPENRTTKFKCFHRIPAPACLLLLFFFSIMASGASGQSVTWSDSFTYEVAPTIEQCQNWTAFLNSLKGKKFVSVTMSGSNDPVGKTLNDPVATLKLAELLSTKTPGFVTSGSDRWAVTSCGATVCNIQSVALSVNGAIDQCSCDDTFSVRPHVTDKNWGGLNTRACGAPSQTMKIVFNSGVSITADGSTSFCEGGSVVLTANSQICSAPLSYKWSNGDTTQSITVTKAGSYSVTVSDGNNCSGISANTVVNFSDANIHAGEDLTYCEEAVQLDAVSETSSMIVNKVCIMDAEGDDCIFSENLCTDGYKTGTVQEYSKTVSVPDPEELRFNLYYANVSNATKFTFKLNGEVVGKFEDNTIVYDCFPINDGTYPRSIPLLADDFLPLWRPAGENKLTVTISSEGDGEGVYVAGITAEVVSKAVYRWSPSEGLSDASIKNPLASPLSSTVYTVSYTGPNGCISTDEVEVKVNCDNAPIAVCKEVSVFLKDGCDADVNPEQFNDGSTSTSGGELTFSVLPTGPFRVGTTDVVFTVTDSKGGSSSCNTTVTVTDKIPPLIAAPKDILVANDRFSCLATIALVAPETSDNCAIESVVHDQAGNIFPPGETLVTWTVKDIHGNTETAVQKVIVNNADPVINSVTVSSNVVNVSNPITLTTSYTDNNVSTATIDWGDLSSAETVNSPDQIFQVSHSYADPGSYTVTVTVTDHCHKSTSYVSKKIKVFDSRGSVKGDGWFNSKPGYYSESKGASGKAQFHLNAEYKTGRAGLSGSISFKFKAGKLDFRSTQLDRLLIDDDRATLTGSGKVNGSRGYSIMISAVDEDWHDDSERHGKNDKNGKKHKKEDQIRVKIWDPSGYVIYDTQGGESDDAIATTDIGGGTIAINKKKSTFEGQIEDIIDSYFGDEATAVYPNPFTEWINVKFSSASGEQLVIEVMDLRGKVMAREVYRVSEDGLYSLDIPDNVRPGIYIVIIKQGEKVEFLRAVRK